MFYRENAVEVLLFGAEVLFLLLVVFISSSWFKWILPYKIQFPPHLTVVIDRHPTHYKPWKKRTGVW